MLAFLYKKRMGVNLASNERMGIFLVISILVASYVLFFIFQITSEFATLNAVFTSNRQSQIQVTKAVATLANTRFHEIEGVLRDAESKSDLAALATQKAGSETIKALSSIHNTLLVVGGAEENEVSLIDSNNRVVASQGSLAPFQPGESVSGYPWASQVKESNEPIFSGLYKHGDVDDNNSVSRSSSVEKNLVSFVSPVRDEKGNLLGMIAVTLPATYLQSVYQQSGLLAVDSSATDAARTYNYVAILDKNLGFLTSSDLGLVGTSLVQDIGEVPGGTDPTIALRSIFSGRSDWSGGQVYRNSEEEFLITAQPITFFDKPEYLVVIKSNTANFYSQVEPVLYQNRIQMFSVLAATAVLTVAIASFISRNINLDKQVRDKTKELSESNRVITTQKIQLEKANEELKRLDALKTEFIGIASHELKTPIQPILLYAELAKYGDVEKDAALDIIFKQATRLKQLSQDILDVSRIDSKSLKLEKQPAKVANLLKDAIASQKGKLRPKVSIVLDVDDESTSVSIDGPRISQVLNNILDNAIKFTQEGTITVKKRSIVTGQGADQKSTMEISVADTGLGIPDEVLPNLFGKFITKDSNGMNPHGTGLGLFICKGIVEAHGGKIWAESSKSKGTTFTFTLPIA